MDSATKAFSIRPEIIELAPPFKNDPCRYVGRDAPTTRSCMADSTNWGLFDGCPFIRATLYWSLASRIVGETSISLPDSDTLSHGTREARQRHHKAFWRPTSCSIMAGLPNLAAITEAGCISVCIFICIYIYVYRYLCLCLHIYKTHCIHIHIHIPRPPNVPLLRALYTLLDSI